MLLNEEDSAFLRIGLVLKGTGTLAVLCVAGALVSGAWSRETALIVAFWMAAAFFSFLSTIGLVILLAKVVMDRLENKEDDHYSKNVER